MALSLTRENGTLIKAHLGVFEGADWIEVVIDSAGGTGVDAKNPDYAEAIEVLLARLGNLDALLIAVVLNSRPVAHVALNERVITLDEYSYPVRLAAIRDASELRKAVASSSARQLSDSVKGGNPRRRLSFLVTFPHPNGPDIKSFTRAIGAKKSL